MDDQAGNIGQLYTLAEAASLTGMSVDVLRHRVKRRKLQSVRGNDGMTRVRLDNASIQASRASLAGNDAASVLYSVHVRTRKLRTSEMPLISGSTRQSIFGFSRGRSIHSQLPGRDQTLDALASHVAM